MNYNYENATSHLKEIFSNRFENFEVANHSSIWGFSLDSISGDPDISLSFSFTENGCFEVDSDNAKFTQIVSDDDLVNFVKSRIDETEKIKAIVNQLKADWYLEGADNLSILSIYFDEYGHSLHHDNMEQNKNCFIRIYDEDTENKCHIYITNNFQNYEIRSAEEERFGKGKIEDLSTNLPKFFIYQQFIGI